MRLLGAAQVGLGHDLDQGHARAVEVDAAPSARPGEALVEQLPRVLLHVDPREAHPPVHAVRRRERDEPGRGERPLVLRDLVALREVGVEVVLPLEDRHGLDGAARGEGRAQGQGDRLAVEDGQRPGQPQADRADERVRLGAEAVGAAAEQLGAGQELGVHLEPDDGLVAGDELLEAAHYSWTQTETDPPPHRNSPQPASFVTTGSWTCSGEVDEPRVRPAHLHPLGRLPGRRSSAPPSPSGAARRRGGPSRRGSSGRGSRSGAPGVIAGGRPGTVSISQRCDGITIR